MAKLNTSNSIVDLLKSQGKDSSKDARTELAKQYGITNYTGTAEQNSALLKAVKGDTTTSSSGSGSAAQAKSSQRRIQVNTLKKGTGVVQPASLDTVNSTPQPVQGGIISEETLAAINNPFVLSGAASQAWDFTNGLLAQLNTGRTSYSDQVDAMIKQIQNREEFEYDVTQDTLFQQALSSAMQSGKTAMQDTMGQASALTGGYGSTYAQSAGNQAYNAYIQDAYANLPEYYQMALEAYQMEGEDMYNQLAMLSDADAREYERTYNAWSANFSNAQNMYQNEYTAWHDSVNTALSMAGLELQEQGQLFDQNFSLMQFAENQRQYDTSLAEDRRQYDMSYSQNEDHFSRSLAEESKQHEREMTLKEESLAWEKDLAQMQAAYKAEKASGEPLVIGKDELTKALEMYDEDGETGILNYVAMLEASGFSEDEIQRVIDYVAQVGENNADASAEKIKKYALGLFGIVK